MKTIRHSTALLAATLIACGGGGGITDGGDGGGGGAGGTPSVSRVYQGTATTQAQFIDLLRGPKVATYQRSVVIEISPPLRAELAGQVENNPFNFSLLPFPANATRDEGQYSILSAGISFQGSPSSELLVQYWQFTANGNNISGTLTNPQNSLAASANLINLPQDLSGGLFITTVFALGQGTSLTGTVTDNEVRLKVSGNAIDGAHPFISDLVAQRVR